MARLCISAHFVLPGRVGGAEYMLYNLLSGLAAVKAPGDEIYVDAQAQLRWQPSGPGIRCSLGGLRPPGNRFLRETGMLLREAKRYDGFLFPNYFTPPVPTPGRLVTIIHDQQYRHFPENFSVAKRAWLRWAHRHTLEQADRVVVISDFVKQDLLRTHGDRFADRLVVIPNPISWERFTGDGERFMCHAERSTRVRERSTLDGEGATVDGLRRPYILSLAAHYPHKNLETLIRAFARLLQRRPEVQLCLVGQRAAGLVGVARRSRVEELVAELGLAERVVITGHLTDGQVGRLFAEASLFVFPSLFEGFGMPPVEALGLGLPVLTTSCTALPEVTRGLAVYVEDPTDPAEMAALMQEMLAQPERYRPSPGAVQELRDHYAPERVARAYYELLTG